MIDGVVDYNPSAAARSSCLNAAGTSPLSRI